MAISVEGALKGKSDDPCCDLWLPGWAIVPSMDIRRCFSFLGNRGNWGLGNFSDGPVDASFCGAKQHVLECAF